MKLLRIAVIGMVLLFVVGGCSAFLASIISPATSTAGLDPAQNQYGASSETPAVTAGVADGTWEVGPDIQAGKYKSSGGEYCYWERQSNDSGELNGIIANSISPGPQVVTIKKTDYAFQTQGCAPWIKQETK